MIGWLFPLLAHIVEFRFVFALKSMAECAERAVPGERKSPKYRPEVKAFDLFR